jgi:hypothetical protein
MKRVGRRAFAKGMGITAALTPVFLSADAVVASVLQPATSDSAAGNLQTVGTGVAADNLAETPLNAKQQNKLAEAIVRRDAQLAQLHARALPYELEPAFVFRARVPPRSGRKA